MKRHPINITTIIYVLLHLVVLALFSACTKSKPPLSISTVDELQTAIDNAEPGDTIFLQDVTYKIAPTSCFFQ